MRSCWQSTRDANEHYQQPSRAGEEAVSEQTRIDYGEPWHLGPGYIARADNRSLPPECDCNARIVSCVNSLAGVADPQGAIDKARDTLGRLVKLLNYTGYLFDAQYAKEALAALTPTNTP
jgi:hypothetical protein